MKKLNTFVGALITTAVLTGCGTHETTFAPILSPADSSVSVQSAQGLKTFYNLLTEKVFVSLDTNKDKNVSFEEFKNRPNMTPGFSPDTRPAIDPHMSTQIEPVRAPGDTVKPPAPVDPLQ